MSLTGTHHAFASLGEQGVNDAIQAFFTARPRFLHYGSAPFVAMTTVTATSVPSIPFPGIPGGISYEVRLSMPIIDLYPPDGPLPPPLVLGPDQLSLTVKARITLGCWRGEGSDKQGSITPIATDLQVSAIGHPISQFFGPGVGDIFFQVDDVDIVDVTPESLEAILNCLLRMILNSVLSNLRLPFSIVDAQFFKLSLEAGPEISDDQIKIWGDIS